MLIMTVMFMMMVSMINSDDCDEDNDHYNEKINNDDAEEKCL